MSDAEKHSLVAGLAHAAAAFAQTPLPYLVGVGVMIAASHWDGHLQSQKGCVEVQHVAGHYFKVDTCTGKTEEIQINLAPVVVEKNAPMPSQEQKPQASEKK